MRNKTVHMTQVAHDFQNRISSIISACEYLATYSPENLNPDQREMIVQIGSSAATLVELSQEISEYTKTKPQRTTMHSRRAGS
jgi:hypothetical protein